MIIIQWFDSPNCLFNSDLFILFALFSTCDSLFRSQTTGLVLNPRLLFLVPIFCFCFCLFSFFSLTSMDVSLPPVLLLTPFSQLFVFVFFKFICQIGTVMELWHRRNTITAQQFGFCSCKTSWKEQLVYVWQKLQGMFILTEITQPFEIQMVDCQPQGKFNAWSVNNAEGLDWWSWDSDQCLWRGWAGCEGPPDEVAWSATFPEVSGWMCSLCFSSLSYKMLFKWPQLFKRKKNTLF